MRTIQKSSPPQALVEWTAKYKDDPNFGYDLMRKDKAVTAAVMDSLLAEQGSLCAYTGRPISAARCHIEHLKPQAHCARGEDVAYWNLVACYPRPNAGRAPYGAHQKDNWPPPTEQHLFVSPLSSGCESRFLFDRRGAISSPESDAPAETTICKLKLDHRELTRLRREAIDGIRNPRRKVFLTAAQLQKALDRLSNETGSLRAYCFSTKQGLAHLIRKAT